MTDVIIAGGGPAGALAALLLARDGARVRVLERARFPRRKLCGDTLNPGALAVLARHVDLAPLLAQGRPIDGMLLTGPGGARVTGRYAVGLPGCAIERGVLDDGLLRQAANAGASVEQEVAVSEPLLDRATGRAAGVRVRTARGQSSMPARLVIGADGWRSRLAGRCAAAHTPARPRRWAIGAYFAGVEGLSPMGEMHVRSGHYIGVAPLGGGLANVCLVVSHRARARGWRDVAGVLTAALARDLVLAPRFAAARMAGPPVVLGPMAVDVPRPGAPGLLLAGDAAGFIDPITGDGLHFALAGAVLAAGVAAEALTGRCTPEHAVRLLSSRRHAAFAAKWRFNRTLRRVVASPSAITAAALLARLTPGVFESIIRYAGDTHR